MSRFFIFTFSLFFLNNAMSAEIFTIDIFSPVEDQIKNSCPWISLEEVQKLKVAEPEQIGWSGGNVGKALGDILEDTGLETNFSIIAAHLPQKTKAILFDTQYFNNNGAAILMIEDISLITLQGDKISLALSDNYRELNQTIEHSGESLLVCFTNDESYVRVSTRVSHKNVDGSRPTLGISALVKDE